jgi:hypothetical protein
MSRISQRLISAARVLRYGERKSRLGSIPSGITQDEIEEVKQFFPMEKFFIFGHARSGTTLLARLIRVHPKIHCNWQAHFFTRPPFLSALVSDPEVSEWLSRKSNRWNIGRDLSPMLMRVASDFMLEREARNYGKNVVGDKSPNNLVNGEAVQRMAAIYPDAKLIFIVRDGRDAALSHQIQKFIDLPDQLSAEDSGIRQVVIENPQKFSKEHRSIFSKSSITTAAQDWKKNVTETDSFGRDIYNKNYKSVRFEDLVDNPLSSLNGIWSFLGQATDMPGLDQAVEEELSRNPDADWQQEKQQQVASIVRKGLPGSWREIFSTEDIKIFKDIAGEALINWGYEQDLGW